MTSPDDLGAVKRYVFVAWDDDTTYARRCEVEDGDYVLYSALASRDAESARLREDNQKLQAENERLRGCIARMTRAALEVKALLIGRPQEKPVTDAEQRAEAAESKPNWSREGE